MKNVGFEQNHSILFSKISSILALANRIIKKSANFPKFPKFWRIVKTYSHFLRDFPSDGFSFLNIIYQRFPMLIQTF